MNEKYTIINNDNLEFKELFDISEHNLSYYFSNYCNSEPRIKKAIERLGLTSLHVNMFATPQKGSSKDYSDIETKDARIYNNFIRQVLKQSHVRNGLNYVEYLPFENKQGHMSLSYLFEKPTLAIYYFTMIMDIGFTFDKDGLKIIYTINDANSKKMLLDIRVNPKNEILSTTVFFNGDVYKEPENIVLNHKQLDYLIAFCHYGMIEDLDFNIDTYIDHVLTENYKDVLNYFKVKEMNFI